MDEQSVNTHVIFVSIFIDVMQRPVLLISCAVALIMCHMHLLYARTVYDILVHLLAYIARLPLLYSDAYPASSMCIFSQFQRHYICSGLTYRLHIGKFVCTIDRLDVANIILSITPYTTCNTSL